MLSPFGSLRALTIGCRTGAGSGEAPVLSCGNQLHKKRPGSSLRNRANQNALRIPMAFMVHSPRSRGDHVPIAFSEVCQIVY
jgi:hypothetical protein